MSALASEYIGRGVGPTAAAGLLHIPRCALYRTPVQPPSGKGRRYSEATLRRTGDHAFAYLINEQVVEEMKALLSKEFVCYGYKKVTKHLQREGFVINRKEVRRLMAWNGLLNNSYNRRSPVSRVVESKVSVSAPNQVWETDIKYVWIAGEESILPRLH